jgi:hypothetical protein
MTKVRNRTRREVAVPTPFQEARDELFQHIMQCNVIGAHPADVKEWFDATMQYMADRYHELSQRELNELRATGENFVRPAKANPDAETGDADPATADTASTETADAEQEAATV